MLRRRSAIAGLPQRPDIEIIDMVTDMAAVPAETRSGSARAVFLKRAGRDPQIMRRLFGAEEGRPLQRTRRARILVVVVARHHGPRSFQARPRAACRGDRLEQSVREDRKSTRLNSSH